MHTHLDTIALAYICIIAPEYVHMRTEKLMVSYYAHTDPYRYACIHMYVRMYTPRLCAHILIQKRLDLQILENNIFYSHRDILPYLLPTFGLVWFLCLMAYQPSLFNAKAILLEEQWWFCNLTHSWEDKGVRNFPKGICPKVNITARLEFELACYDFVDHRFNHYTPIYIRIISPRYVYQELEKLMASYYAHKDPYRHALIHMQKHTFIHTRYALAHIYS